MADGAEPKSKPGGGQPFEILADPAVVAERSRKVTIAIIVSPVAHRPGCYSAHIERGDLLVACSHTPFLDAARVLIAAGFDAATKMVMMHAGSTTECLRASIGTAARLTVEESAHGPVFRRHRMALASAVEGASVRSRDHAATPMADRPPHGGHAPPTRTEG